MNDNYKIPVPKFLVKELTFWVLPHNLAVLMGGVMVLSAVVLKSIPIFIIFFIIYISLVILIKVNPKFDPKIVEIISKMTLKKYINY